MIEINIRENESGQRFDKFLFKYFKEAGAGFIYKMLRKKNIVLNDKKSDGKEKLVKGDIVKVYMADETISKFRGEKDAFEITDYNLNVVYEDEDILIVNKPSGVLSQKSEKDDISINEDIISYLIDNHVITQEELKTFKPSICNRLDRNTSGLVVAGKTLHGLQAMNKMFKDRTMDKYYLALVNGRISKKSKINGYLKKNEITNKVLITKNEEESSKYIETEYEPISNNEYITLLKVKLITGKTHQIRAHLASIGHSIIGDYKYGNKKSNDFLCKKYNVKDQLLHSWKLIFPEKMDDLNQLEGLEITGECPNIFKEIISKELDNKGM